jgi:hypothetical protein
MEHTGVKKKKLSFSVGQYITVLQAKAYAIKSCEAENTDRGYDSGNADICILPDSHAAIGALKNY